jgi:hypothetical protein
MALLYAQECIVLKGNDDEESINLVAISYYNHGVQLEYLK